MNWTSAASATQFMARGSSHELAALLLTKTTLYVNHTLGIPLYILLLDKQAAFDSVLKEHVITTAFSAARIQGKVIMGPIHDTVGIEQGGISSSDQFQLVNGDELALLSPHPAALQSLLNLSEAFSISTSLTNVPEKTKLLVYPASGTPPPSPTDRRPCPS